MKCKKCGTEFSEGIFCPMCGMKNEEVIIDQEKFVEIEKRERQRVEETAEAEAGNKIEEEKELIRENAEKKAREEAIRVAQEKARQRISSDDEDIKNEALKLIREEAIQNAKREEEIKQQEEVRRKEKEGKKSNRRAILSLILGIVSWVGMITVIIPIVGGIWAIVDGCKALKGKTKYKKSAIIGMVLPILLYVLIIIVYIHEVKAGTKIEEQLNSYIENNQYEEAHEFIAQSYKVGTLSYVEKCADLYELQGMYDEAVDLWVEYCSSEYEPIDIPDFRINKLNEYLDKYETDLKPETIEKVHNLINNKEVAKEAKEAEEQAAKEAKEVVEQAEEKEVEPEKKQEGQINAETEFLTLLKEEYENGFVKGEGARHTYYSNIGFYDKHGYGRQAFIYNGVVYMPHGTYDIAAKEYNVWEMPNINEADILDCFFIDGNFYMVIKYWGSNAAMICIYDCNGVLLNTFQFDEYWNVSYIRPFDKGIFCQIYYDDYFILSYNLEKIAEISSPQYEIEHGLKENMNLVFCYTANETAYAVFSEDDSLYRLNTDTYEWENTGNDAPILIDNAYYDEYSFYGKYVIYADNNDGISDIITGEQVFEYGELYAPLYSDLKYFGGEKYLGYGKNYIYDTFECRWVNLTDLSMSEPLLFPYGKDYTILNDTYCIYCDSYGWFLWNYNDGIEETIMMFDDYQGMEDNEDSYDAAAYINALLDNVYKNDSSQLI